MNYVPEISSSSINVLFCCLLTSLEVLVWTSKLEMTVSWEVGDSWAVSNLDCVLRESKHDKLCYEIME